MERFIVEGMNKICGKAEISPAKNACLPIIAASLAFPVKVFLKKAPFIKDVVAMAEIAESLGGEYRFESGGLKLDLEKIDSYVGKPDIYRRVRASLFTAGALLSRFKKAVIPYPGGCNIGLRPVDIHVAAFKALGAKVECEKDYIVIDGTLMRCGYVKLRFPSVGATVNAICASIFLKGETVISNAAKEPEIADLCNFLNVLGCRVCGGGTSVVVIYGIGRDKFDSISYTPVFDRIEAGTFMACCLAVGGDLCFDADCYNPLRAAAGICAAAGAKIAYSNGTFYMSVKNRPSAVDFVADVYPAFPTDLQPQFCAALTKAKGKSRARDAVFPERFSYLFQLNKFGAACRLKDGIATIRGVKKLNGAVVEAPDLRAGAALVVAALAADGESVIYGADYVRRGYADLDKKLRGLGCKIVHKFDDDE